MRMRRSRLMSLEPSNTDFPWTSGTRTSNSRELRFVRVVLCLSCSVRYTARYDPRRVLREALNLRKFVPMTRRRGDPLSCVEYTYIVVGRRCLMKVTLCATAKLMVISDWAVVTARIGFCPLRRRMRACWKE